MAQRRRAHRNTLGCAPEDAGQRLVKVLLVSVAVASHILPHLLAGVGRDKTAQ